MNTILKPNARQRVGGSPFRTVAVLIAFTAGFTTASTFRIIWEMFA